MALPSPDSPFKARGAQRNPANRFDQVGYEVDPEISDPLAVAETEAPPTRYLADGTRTIIAYNDSPDIHFNASVNPYRGCEHGCIYCYARPTHEYLGMSAGLDFESVIMVKHRAPELLREELTRPSWEPQTLAFSGVTDCYQPIEKELRLTRHCLEVCADFRNPVGIVTKNRLITRDLDVLHELARFDAVCVCITVTSLDLALARELEPRAPLPQHRLAAIRALADAGIPVGVLVAPVIPGLTDEQIPGILRAAAGHGARFAGYVMLRLPHAVKELFSDWLHRRHPARAARVLDRVANMRHGCLNNTNYAERMSGDGQFADMTAHLFDVARRQAGLTDRPQLSAAHFRRHDPRQPELF